MVAGGSVGGFPLRPGSPRPPGSPHPPAATGGSAAPLALRSAPARTGCAACRLLGLRLVAAGEAALRAGMLPAARTQRGCAQVGSGVPGTERLFPDAWLPAPSSSRFPHRPACFNLDVVFSVSSSLLSQKPPAPWQHVRTREPERRVLLRDMELDFHPANECSGGQNLCPLPRACPLLRLCTQRLGMGCSGCVLRRGVRQRDVTGSRRMGKRPRARAAAGSSSCPAEQWACLARGVPSAAVLYPEFTLDFGPALLCHACARGARRERCCLCPWAHVRPGAPL